MNSKRKYIFLDTETTHLLEDVAPEQDILLQLSYIVIDGTNHYVQDVKCNPGIDPAPETSMFTNITPEDIIGLPKVQDTEEYKTLKELVQSKEYTFVAHNAKFDIEVLKRVGIDIEGNCDIIDTYMLAEFLNDVEGLPRKLNKLGYLFYYYKLYKQKEKINEKFGISNYMYHEAVSDILDTILLFNYIKKTYNPTYEEMVRVSNEPLKYTYVPFGKNRGEKFEDLSYNQLKYYSTLDNKNVAYTAGLYI